jgi:hypothetical protein
MLTSALPVILRESLGVHAGDETHLKTALTRRLDRTFLLLDVLTDDRQWRSAA